MLQYEPLVIGIAAGLCLSTVLRWAPSWRELLAAAVAAILIDLVINSQLWRAFDFAGLAGATARLSREIPVYPHVCPCIALAFIGILAVLHVVRAG